MWGTVHDCREERIGRPLKQQEVIDNRRLLKSPDASKLLFAAVNLTVGTGRSELCCRYGTVTHINHPYTRICTVTVNSPSPKKKEGLVRVKPGSDRFRPIVHPLNLDLDLRFGSGNSLNLGPNLGPVQAGSGSNRGSEPDRGITSYHSGTK